MLSQSIESYWKSFDLQRHFNYFVLPHFMKKNHKPFDIWKWTDCIGNCWDVTNGFSNYATSIFAITNTIIAVITIHIIKEC